MELETRVTLCEPTKAKAKVLKAMEAGSMPRSQPSQGTSSSDLSTTYTSPELWDSPHHFKVPDLWHLWWQSENQRVPCTPITPQVHSMNSFKAATRHAGSKAGTLPWQSPVILYAHPSLVLLEPWQAQTNRIPEHSWALELAAPRAA